MPAAGSLPSRGGAVERARKLADEGRLESAHAALSAAVRADSSDWNARDRRAQLRHRLGDLTGADLDYSYLIRQNPRHSASFEKRAVVRLARRRTQTALSDFDEAIRLRPTSVKFSRRAEVKASLGDVEGALADYDAGIGLNNGFAHEFCGRAALRASVGDLQGALLDYSQAIEIDPNSAVGYFERAGVLEANGETSAAQNDYEEASRLDPTFATTHTRHRVLCGLQIGHALASALPQRATSEACADTGTATFAAAVDSYLDAQPRRGRTTARPSSRSHRSGMSSVRSWDALRASAPPNAGDLRLQAESVLPRQEAHATAFFGRSFSEHALSQEGGLRALRSTSVHVWESEDSSSHDSSGNACLGLTLQKYAATLPSKTCSYTNEERLELQELLFSIDSNLSGYSKPAKPALSALTGFEGASSTEAPSPARTDSSSSAATSASSRMA